MSRSEFRCLAILNSSKKGDLTQIELYKACSALSLNGLSHPDRIYLDPVAKQLLDVRSSLKARKLSTAENLLESIEKRNDLRPYYRGDVVSIRAYMDHIRGDMRGAAAKFEKSIGHYAEEYDEHREMFIRINSMICSADLPSFNAGALASLEQAAHRSDYPDLIATIRRGRAHELMTLGKFSEACIELTEAIRMYDLDGNPEDRAVAVCMLALSECLLGLYDKAAITLRGVRIADGRIPDYLACYNSLAAGKVPTPPEGHPLYEIPWKGMGVKPDSIPGKILRILMRGPATRDELIAEIWGRNAIHPSYCSRLHFALNKLKKSGKINVVFDGSRYRAA